jgi:trehalose 6-phosphate phosphatase
MCSLPAAGSDLGELAAPLRAAPDRSAVLCDIDGTLAPIVRDPSDAGVPAEARELLRSLSREYALVACISGRRASQARRLVGLEELTYAGNHGLELLAPEEIEPRVDPALGHRGAAAASFVARLDWEHLRMLGLRLEDKGPIQAIHWRRAPDEEVAEQRARELAELVEEEGLVPHFGRKVLEVRPVASVDKGTAVRRLLGEVPARRALYGGDDLTDAQAFAALRAARDAGELEVAACVGVASEEAPPALVNGADVLVDGTTGFLAVLRALAT